jgi:6-phosphogluconolactonase
VDGAPKPPPSRVTFTLPLINAARHVAFLVTGADKNAALRRVLNGDPALPAARVAPRDGALDAPRGRGRPHGRGRGLS